MRSTRPGIEYSFRIIKVELGVLLCKNGRLMFMLANGRFRGQFREVLVGCFRR